jgi:hypothetical protein
VRRAENDAVVDCYLCLVGKVYLEDNDCMMPCKTRSCKVRERYENRMRKLIEDLVSCSRCRLRSTASNGAEDEVSTKGVPRYSICNSIYQSKVRMEPVLPDGIFPKRWMDSLE